MKLKFVSELIQIASLRFIEALEGSKITLGFSIIEMKGCRHRFSKAEL